MISDREENLDKIIDYVEMELDQGITREEAVELVYFFNALIEDDVLMGQQEIK